jgi:YggT family protein
MMTEPVISPIRKLLYRFEFAKELPVDFSPMIAIIVLYIISMIISQF